MSCQVSADTAIGTFCSVSSRRLAVTTTVPSVVTVVSPVVVAFGFCWSHGAFCACASGAPNSAAAIAAERRSDSPPRLLFMAHLPKTWQPNRRMDCYYDHIHVSMLSKYQIAPMRSDAMHAAAGDFRHLRCGGKRAGVSGYPSAKE